MTRANRLAADTGQFTPSRVARRKPRRPARPYLELLEDRTLLNAAYPFHPEAMLRPFAGAGAAPRAKLSPSWVDDSQQGPLGPRFANILVNDPGEDGTSNQDTQSETSLYVTGTTVVAAFNDSFLYHPGTSQHFTGFSRSSDRGGSFTDAGGLPTTPGGDVGDPVLAHDNQTGRSYFSTLSFNSNSIKIFRSDDNFATFLSTVDATRAGGNLDKEWMVADNFAGAGQGNVYLIVRDFGSGNGIYLFRSTDQGAMFGPSGGVAIVGAGGGNVQGAWVAVGPDHAVYAFWYQSNDIGGNSGRIMMRKSTDQGVTFGPAILITNLATVGINGDLHVGGFRSNAFPQALVNPINNDIYVVYDDKGSGSDRADVFFRQSIDGGATWGPAMRVVDDTTGRDQWQPALAVTPNGNKVGVFWYDRRLDPANNLIDRFGAIGVVAGHTVTFGPNFRISDASFPPAFGRDPVVNSVYMGDYDQAVADSGSFYLTWGDNRLPSPGHGGIPYADVRFARIPVDVAGPSVIAINPSGNIFPPFSQLRVTFDEEILVKTATADQFIVTDPNGKLVTLTDISPVKGSNNQQFDLTFDTRGLAGAYTVDIGPFIQDTAGHYMDQDGDGTPGEKTDVFHGRVVLQGPTVIRLTPNTSIFPPVDTLHAVFNVPMDIKSFSDQVSLTDPNGKGVSILSVTETGGTGGREFDITVTAQGLAGTYTAVLGAGITDRFGNSLPGPFTSQFTIQGPSVVRVTPNSSVFAPVGTLHVVFNVPINTKSFTTKQVSLTDPGGSPVPISAVTETPQTGSREFDVTIKTQVTAGTYNVVLGTGITDQFANPLAQPFMSTFSIVGPSVLSTTLNGRLADEVDHGRVIFNTPIDPKSFTFEQFNLTGPGGPVNVISITAVDETNRAFDVTFENQTRLGMYTLVIGPDITDAFGNSMPAPYRGGFTLTSERIVNGCFDTGNFMGWTQSGNPGFTGVGTTPVHDPCHHSAFLGPVGSEGFLAQRFPTTPGVTYVLNYWLQHDGGSPSSFHAMIDGVDIPGSVLMDPSAFDYREYTFMFVAAGDQTELKFGFREDPAYFHLDDISVNPMTGPSGNSSGNPAFVSAMSVHAPAVGVSMPPDLALVPAAPHENPPAAIPTSSLAAGSAEAVITRRWSTEVIDGFFASRVEDWNDGLAY